MVYISVAMAFIINYYPKKFLSCVLMYINTSASIIKVQLRAELQTSYFCLELKIYKNVFATMDMLDFYHNYVKDQ